MLALREEDGSFNTNPSPDTTIRAGQVLIAIGTPTELDALERTIEDQRLSRVELKQPNDGTDRLHALRTTTRRECGAGRPRRCVQLEATPRRSLPTGHCREKGVAVESRSARHGRAMRSGVAQPGSAPALGASRAERCAYTVITCGSAVPR